MASWVYAYCTSCKTRRDQSLQGGSFCTDKPGHKRYVKWTAEAQYERNGPRPSRRFDTEEKAKKQTRIWDKENDDKVFGIKKENSRLFSEALEKYKKEHVMIYNHLPETSTIYRLNLLDEKLGKYALKDITRQLLAEIRSEVSADRDWEGATTNRTFRIVHAILEKAREWEWMDKNPMEFLEPLPESETHPRFLSELEILRLWKHIKSPVLDYYALAILRTGARPSSLNACSFENGDVDLENKVIWFTTYKGHKGKKLRYAVPIDKDLYPRIKARFQECGGIGRVFPSANVRRLAATAIEESGINKGKETKFTIYGLKHCYASHLIMNGASESAVAELLGHTDTKMIRKHYAHLTVDHLREAQAAWSLVPQMEEKFAKLEVI